MKQGKNSIVELAQAIQANSEMARDYVADTRKLHLEVIGDGESKQVIANVDGVGFFAPQKIAHQQIAAHTSIPKPYYDRMMVEAPDLLTTNVNRWFNQEFTNRMLRTTQRNGSPTLRAFLSDRYRSLDYLDLMEAALPVLAEAPDMVILSCEATETRMYIKALFPRIESEVKVGDTVQSGVVISNSEVGHGALKVEPLVYRLVCLNGMVSPHAMRKYHVGSRTGSEGEAFEIYRDETKEQTDKALWMQVQDTIRAATDPAIFEGTVNRMREATEQPITADPVEVVERVQKQFRFTDGERSGILTHLIQGGDLSAYGMLNAITRTSQDVDDYDRATDLERAGGQVLELNRAEWQRLAA